MKERLTYVTTQSLRPQPSKANYLIKHKVFHILKLHRHKTIDDTTVFIQLPYDKSNPYKSLIDEWEDFAFSRNKNHSYIDKRKCFIRTLGSPIGKNTYRAR
jgi:hypothetical protein